MKRIIIVLCMAVFAFGAGSAFAQNKVVVIPLNSKSKVNTTTCPATAGDALAGPTEMYNFCWYLSADGINCDKTCADVGGTNLAYGAEGWWADACTSPGTPEDVTTWFYNNGNAGNWTGDPAGATGYHTLGYGYDGGAYYGKCASGTASENGAYPGDPSNRGNRNVVCACFVKQP